MGDHNFKLVVDQLINDTGLDKDFCAELVQLFHLRSKEILQLAHEASLKNDVEQLKKHIHTIKGSAGNVRAKKVWEKALQIEETLKNDSCSDIQKDLFLLEKAIDDVVL